MGSEDRFPATDGPPAAATRGEWLRVCLLSANLAWTTLCLGGFLPGTRVAMAVMSALLVAAHFLDPRAARRGHPAAWLFVPFVAYAAANVEWLSPVRWLGWLDWINWAQALAIFWVVLNGVPSRAGRAALAWVVAVLGVTACAMAAYQHFEAPSWIMLGRTQAPQFVGRSSGCFGIPNSLGVFMALLIPPAAALAWEGGRAAWLRVLAAAALCAFAVGFVLAISRGAWIALAGACVLRALLGPGHSIARRIASSLAVVGAVALAAVVLYLAFPLMRERVDQLVRDAGERTRPVMWLGAWRIFEAHPILGGGGGGYDVLFEAYRPQGFRDQPIYAHCDYLNTLCDYGALGFVLLFGAAAAVGWRCAGARGLAGAAFTGLLAFALHLLVDFHLKIPALAMIVATVGACVVRVAWPSTDPGPAGAASRAAGVLAAAAALGFGLFWAVPKFQAEEWRRQARESIDKMASGGADVVRERAALAEARGRLARAVARDPGNARAWSDKAYADSLWALVEPARTVELGAEAEADARRALALSSVVSEFWIRLGTGLDMERRWADGGDCFVQALKIAPMRADTWYYRAYHLSLSSSETGPAEAAASISLRLDPEFLLAQSLRQRLEARSNQSP